jgi:hypothetical protein
MCAFRVSLTVEEIMIRFHGWLMEIQSVFRAMADSTGWIKSTVADEVSNAADWKAQKTRNSTVKSPRTLRQLYLRIPVGKLQKI